MVDITRKIFIKYGLGRNPTDQQLKQWVEEAESLIRRGVRPEQAGETAARRIFPDFNTRVYASEADTIEALLAEAAERARRGH